MYTLQNWRTALTAGLRAAIFTVLAATVVAGLATLLGAKVAQANTPTAAAQANTQWVHNFASSQDIEITSMALSANNETFLAGVFHGSVDFDPGDGETLLTSNVHDTSFIAKYDPAGNLVWAYRLAGTDNVRIHDIVIDPMIQIGVVGTFKGEADLDPGPGVTQATSEGGHDIFLLRLLPDGNLQWSWTAGDDNDDAGYAIATDANSGLYITGKFQGTIAFQSFSPVYFHESRGESDLFMARFNNAGVLSWVRSLGGDEDDEGRDIATNNDRVIVTGTFADEVDIDPVWTSDEVRSHGREDIAINVLTLSGEYRWGTYLGGEGSERNPKLLIDDDGYFYLAAEFEGSADLDVRRDGGNVTSRGGYDIFLARYGPRPEEGFQWGYSIGGAQLETLGGLAQDSFGNVYLLGAFGGTVDFDPGDTTTELTSNGAADLFVAQYRRQGAFRQVQQIANPQDARVRGLGINSNDNVIIAGEYSGTLDLGSGMNISTGKTDDAFNAFVAHYTRETWLPLPERAYLPGITAPPVAR